MCFVVHQHPHSIRGHLCSSVVEKHPARSGIAAQMELRPPQKSRPISCISWFTNILVPSVVICVYPWFKKPPPTPPPVFPPCLPSLPQLHPNHRAPKSLPISIHPWSPQQQQGSQADSNKWARSPRAGPNSTPVSDRFGFRSPGFARRGHPSVSDNGKLLLLLSLRQ